MVRHLGAWMGNPLSRIFEEVRERILGRPIGNTSKVRSQLKSAEIRGYVHIKN